VPSALAHQFRIRLGSAWKSNRTATFANRSSFVEYDLGEEKQVDAVALLADNNDSYSVLGSSDGKAFEPIWVAPPVRESGLRWRHQANLKKATRYLRVQPGRGDAALSLGEIAVYSKAPSQLPPRLQSVSASDVQLEFRSALVVAAVLISVSAFAMTQGASLIWNLAFVLLALLGLGRVSFAFFEAFPLGKLEVSLVRGVIATVAAGVVLRGAFAPKQFPPVRWFHVSVLSLLALLSVGAFYNMGHPQFFDAKKGEASVVHNYDMRVYFPVAKYFDELKYDGLYVASVASYAEDHGGVKSPRIQRVELRDLRDHRMRKASELEPEIAEVRSRFSEKRWAEFKKDMKYFWETMGARQYLGSMVDHGGNATPVWLSIAYLMYGSVSASNEVLLFGALLDPLLLLVFFVVAWRTFGAIPACVCLIVFGANDFYMFGSNWAGATLRNDWMVYLGLGVCALKSERFKLGGALLAMSALIRAFPAIALLALGVPLVQAVITLYAREKRWPSVREVYDDQRWFFDTALGATICVLVSVVGSSLVMGADSWPLWAHKISSFTDSPHVNHLSLLTVVAGSEGHQATVLAQRAPAMMILTGLFLTLGVWSAARSAPYRVALLGIMMMPVFMYPANYYIHFIFVLPLLAAEVRTSGDRLERERAGRAWIALLGLCAAQYFTVRIDDLSIHFYNAAVLLMATLLLILVVLLPRDEEGRIDFVRLPFHLHALVPRHFLAARTSASEESSRVVITESESQSEPKEAGKVETLTEKE